MAAGSIQQVLRSFCTTVQDLELPQQIQLASVFLAHLDPNSVLATAFDEAEFHLKSQMQQQADQVDNSLSYTLSCIAASVHLLKQGAPTFVVSQYVEQVFIPVLRLQPGAEKRKQQLQVAVELSHIIQRHGLWESASRIIQSLTLSLEEKAHSTNVQVTPSLAHLSPTQWPLPSMCFTLQQLLQAAGSTQGSAAARSFLEAAVKLLLPSVLGLLHVDDVPVRQAAVHKLLPVLHSAVSHLGGEMESKFGVAVAEACIRGMGKTGSSRQSAMALAVQFCGLLQKELAGPLASQQQEFWGALQACLVDPEPLTRKRAVHVLRAMLEAAKLHTPEWAAWLMLYSLLDEFGMHLIRPAWEQIRVLHPTAAEYLAEEQQRCNTVPPNQKKLRGQKAKRSSAPPEAAQQEAAGADDGAAPKNSESAADPPVEASQSDATELSFGLSASRLGTDVMPELQPGHFSWMQIIWERALLHSNIQVQKLALHSFLQRRWDPAYLATVPIDFMQRVLLTAMVVHTQFKLSSNTSFDVEAALVQFLAAYITAVSDNTRRDIFRLALGVASAKDPLPRQGLLLLLGSFSAAATKVEQQLLVASSPGGWSEEVCACLVSCTISITSYHGLTFRTEAYRSVLELAAALTDHDSLSLASAARLLHELPFHSIQPQGCLHDAISKWLVPNESAHEWFASQMLQLLESYLKDASSPPGVQLTDADITVWEARSRSLALLAIVAGESVNPVLRPLLQALATNMQAIRTRPYLAPGIAERTLILLDSLLFYTLAHLRSDGSSGPAAGQSMPSSCPLATALASLINSHTALLAACCESATQVFWAAPAHIANDGVMAAQNQAPSSESHHSPSPTMRLAGSKAVKGAFCIGRALEFLTLYSVAHGPNLTSATSHLLLWTQDFIIRCQKLGDKHLQGDAGLLQDLLQALEAVSRALAAATRGAALRSADRLCGSLDVAVLLEKVLKIDEGGSRERSPRHWACVDAVLGLHISLKSMMSNAAGAPRQQQTSSKLDADTAAQLLLDTLQTLPGCAPSLLMPLLRCSRLLWSVSLADKTIAAAVASKLDAMSSREGHTDVDAVAWAVSRALLEALDLCSKRKAALCAAFVNTAMLPTVLAYKDDEEDLKALHQPGGALHWLMDALTRMNRPRVIVPLCLRLAQHIITQPQLMANYTKLLQHLLVYASFNKGVSGLDLESSTDAVETEELGAFLRERPDDLQSSYSGTTIAARLALVCAIHSVAQLAGIIHPLLQETSDSALPDTGNMEGSTRSAATLSHPTHQDLYATKARQAGLQLWDCMYSLASTDALLSADKYKVGSELHRQKVRCWQALTVLSSYLPEENMEEVMKQLMDMFNQNNPSQVKMYQEALCTALLLRCPSLLESLILPRLQDVSKASNAISSLILVSAHVALNLPQELRAPLLPKVVEAILPWGLCHAHTVRTFTQLVLHTVWCRVPLDSPVWSGADSGPPLLRRWMKYLETNHDMIRLRNTLGAVMPRFTPHGLTSPHRVFVAGVQLAGGSEEGVMFEGAPPSVMDQMLEFLNTERSKLREALQEREVEQEYFPNTGIPASAKPGTGVHQTAPSGQGIDRAGDFQRKIQPTNQLITSAADSYDPVAELAEFSKLGLWDDPLPSTPADATFLSSGAAALEASGTTGVAGTAGGAQGSASAPRMDTQKPQIIVVASLIDKLPNLAGLARTCEVFQATALALADVRVVKEPTFAAISVTAERWIPVLEVREAALLPWLEKQKQAGWELVGLEQTAEAVPLPVFVWPKKAVLVLGREKEGLPAEVIQMLDHAVEIPQFGFIRSLNVHVSAAITIYEFTKQARMNE